MATTLSDKSYCLNIASPEHWYVQKTSNINLLIHVFIKTPFFYWESGIVFRSPNSIAVKIFEDSGILPHLKFCRIFFFFLGKINAATCCCEGNTFLPQCGLLTVPACCMCRCPGLIHTHPHIRSAPCKPAACPTLEWPLFGMKWCTPTPWAFFWQSNPWHQTFQCCFGRLKLRKR